MTRSGKILIVDDEYDKVKLINNILDTDLNVEIEHVTNSRDAINKISKLLYDLIIIDLQIPESIGDEVDPFGGQRLLEHIDQSNNLNKPTHILGITSHIESYKSCHDSFLKRGWSLVNGITEEDLIKNIVEAKIRHAVDPPKKYDVAILTALEHVELEAVRDLPCNWIPVTRNDDCNIYYSGTIRTSTGKSLNVIATSCHHMGIAQASAIGMKLCLKFKPDYIFMTGIAAGVSGKVNLGDILIVDPCWDWGSGKQTIVNNETKFLSSPRQISLDPLIRAKLKKISTDGTYLDEIYREWPGNKPKTALQSHVGPVATGSVVIEDTATVEMIQSQHRETIGIEMEAYGLALATSISSIQPPKTVIMKSVCDFADVEKGDDWQTFAAYTSAQLALKFITNDLYDN